MITQDFILNELEAIAKDITAIVEEGKALLAIEAAHKQEREKMREQGKGVAVPGRMHDPNKFVPELNYLQRRLAAVREYMSDSVSKQGLQV